MGILGMFTDLLMNLECKIQSRRMLRQNDSLTVRCEHHDIFVIERGNHTVHESPFVTLGQIFQYRAELVDPTASVAFRTVSHTAHPRIARHTGRRDVQLFPRTLFAQQLDVETLVTIFFRGVDVVDDTARFFFEHISQDGVDPEAGCLFRFVGLVGENDADDVAEVNVFEVTALLAHASPDTVGLSVADLRANLQAMFSQ